MKAVLATMLLALTASCGNTPVSVLELDAARVDTQVGDIQATPVDILLVVDHSTSTCEEQSALAQSFAGFLDRLESFVDIDFRIAVVSTDAVSKGHAGAFRHHPKVGLESTCNADRLVPAGTCEEEGPEWSVVGEPVVSWKGQAFERCHLSCNASADCDAALTDATAGLHCAEDNAACEWQCVKSPTFDEGKSCAYRPPTDGCPSDEELRKILGQGHGGVPFITSETRDLFACVSVMPSDPSWAGRHEQPFRAALQALEPTGPNAEQSAAFLRDDAFLLVVMVTDEDDCSTAEGVSLTKEQIARCCVKDGDLMPIEEVANRFKSLKADPAKVLVASIGGDLEGDDATDAAREAYHDWRCSVASPTKVTKHACLGPGGEANVASRFISLNRLMGLAGTFHNICGSDGVAQALEAIADRLAPALMRTCLPYRPLQPSLIRPWVTSADGSTRPLGDEEFTLVNDTTCRPEADYLAVRVIGTLEPGDSISISYDL